jgi:hypothetical protein
MARPLRFTIDAGLIEKTELAHTWQKYRPIVASSGLPHHDGIIPHIYRAARCFSSLSFGQLR